MVFIRLFPHPLFHSFTPPFFISLFIQHLVIEADIGWQGWVYAPAVLHVFILLSQAILLAQNRCRRRQPTAGTLTLGEGLGPSLGTRPWAPPRRLIIFNILLLFVLFFFFCKLVRPPLKALFLRRFAFFWSHFDKMRVLLFGTLIVGYQGGIKMFFCSDAPLFGVGAPPVFKAFYVFWAIFSIKKNRKTAQKRGAR